MLWVCQLQITHTGGPSVPSKGKTLRPLLYLLRGRGAGNWLGSKGRALGQWLVFSGDCIYNTNKFLSFESLPLLLGPQLTLFQQEIKWPQTRMSRRVTTTWGLEENIPESETPTSFFFSLWRQFCSYCCLYLFILNMVGKLCNVYSELLNCSSAFTWHIILTA